MEQNWYKSYDSGVSPTVDFTKVDLTCPGVLKSCVEKFPEVEAIRYAGKVITYKEFGEMTATIAGNFKLFGLEKQDKVCILLPNLPETILSFWSVERAGLTGVMTNPLYSERELMHQINNSESKVIITVDQLLPKVKAVLSETCLKYVFVVRTTEAEVEADGKILPWEELLKANRGYTCDNINPHEDLALLQYTGGTTGISKGCMLTHANILSNAYMLQELFKNELIDGDERFVGVLPYFHVYGLQITMLYPVLIGGTMLPLVRFVPHAFLKLLMNEKITVLASAPSIFSASLTQKDIDSYDISSVKLVISGSAPLPVALMEDFERRTGATIVEGYGLSEASPVTHLSPSHPKVRKPGSIGIPLPSIEAKIVDVEYGIKELPINQNGELCVRGANVMKGYYKNVEATKDVLTDDGWLHTGDIAYVDVDGFCYITDRKKDLIISGGFNVYPREVEEVLYRHPDIVEACVVGVKSELRGEDVKAFIVLGANKTLTERDIISYCRKNLANFKVPRQIEFRESLPKSAVGKILRRELR